MMVRLATAADKEAVIKLIRTMPALPQWGVADLAEDAAVSGSSGVRRVLLVAVNAEGICGFAQTACLLGEVELEGMAVATEQRGQGLGRKLLAVCLHMAERSGATLFRLEVRSENRAAIHLYQSCGLESVGVRRNYYRHPTEDALLMQRNL